jgi:hypothetical protein
LSRGISLITRSLRSLQNCRVSNEAAIRLRYEALDPVLGERSRRRFAAAKRWLRDATG